MCARLELNGTTFVLGNRVPVWLEEGRSSWLTWKGFARIESLQRWLGMGAQLVDIPVRRFGLRSVRTRKLAWLDVPLGQVLRGLVDSNDGRPLLKIVTRKAEVDEAAKFDHPRMPVMEVPRVSAEWVLPPAPVAESSTMVEPRLFAR